MGSIRDELRRFERRRLRPLFRRFKRQREEHAPALPPSTATAEAGHDHEELLVALVRAELRRRTRGLTTDPFVPAGPAGAGEAERLVRSLLAAADVPEAGVTPRSEAA